jgi:hypothetical protein
VNRHNKAHTIKHVAIKIDGRAAANIRQVKRSKNEKWMGEGEKVQK